MIGIYKITNNVNNKCYIGASKDIEKRFEEHKSQYNSVQNYNKTLYRAFRKYGLNNFSFEIIEETSLENMFNREKYWINFYNSYKEGYNETLGGEGGYAPGEKNNWSKLTEKDVIAIRTAYKNKEHRTETWRKYKDKITYAGFLPIWQGKNWKHIMPEIYTEELKQYNLHYSRKGQNLGEANGQAKMTEQEVRDIRVRKKNGEKKKDVYKDYKNKIGTSGFDCIWRYLNWKEVIV